MVQKIHKQENTLDDSIYPDTTGLYLKFSSKRHYSIINLKRAFQQYRLSGTLQ